MSIDITSILQMITFHSDYPIPVLYKKVVAKLEGIDKEEYRKEYERFKKISECSHNPEDRSIAYAKVVRMEKIMKMLDDGTLLSTFKERINPILLKYYEVQGSGYVFGMNVKSDSPKRVYTIVSFFKAINEFVHVEWECTFNMGDVCPTCHKYMEKKGNIMACIDCGASFSIDATAVSVDPEEEPKTSTYKPPKNYRKEYLHLCGQYNHCDVDEISVIRAYLYKHECKNPSRLDIRNAIPRCGYKNYNDTNYIFSQITGEPLPPISEYVVQCSDRFEKYHDMFVQLRIPGNVTNLHFLTKLFLFQEGVETQDDWFRELSPKTEQKHRSNAMRICRLLREKYPDQNWTVPSNWSK